MTFSSRFVLVFMLQWPIIFNICNENLKPNSRLQMSGIKVIDFDGHPITPKAVAHTRIDR